LSINEDALKEIAKRGIQGSALDYSVERVFNHCVDVLFIEKPPGDRQAYYDFSSYVREKWEDVDKDKDKEVLL